jgi:hypothetical protein
MERLTPRQRYFIKILIRAVIRLNDVTGNDGKGTSLLLGAVNQAIGSLSSRTRTMTVGECTALSKRLKQQVGL